MCAGAELALVARRLQRRVAMSGSKISFRVHYLNVVPSETLSAAVEQGMALLDRHAGHVAHCDVHVGRWVQHHRHDSSYRVTLEIEPHAGSLPVSIECESALNAPAPVLLELVREAFQRAVRRLTARAQQAASQPGPMLSPDARRLHPLHGLAPEEWPCGSDDG